MALLKIALDTNVFRNFDFINYLIKKKEHCQVNLPSVVHLELGSFFKSKGLSWETFENDLARINALVLPWEGIDDQAVVENAFANRGELAFRDHFRDFLIGSQCMKLNLDIVTNNKRHFQWCNGIIIMTPDECVEKREEK
ncbi:MAG: type II toxin-antitoxin system VapC family toxin [Candidatus Lokiarchaeota archaeon]|nr:type II toxin-antitoxin system VapC family toxin [Candidatus Lokiarchaeota archaeon]